MEVGINRGLTVPGLNPCMHGGDISSFLSVPLFQTSFSLPPQTGP